jgi:hypothetical protein
LIIPLTLFWFVFVCATLMITPYPLPEPCAGTDLEMWVLTSIGVGFGASIMRFARTPRL